jgi:putative transposase
MFPLADELAADGIPVAVPCRVLGFTKQAFYQWRADPVSQRDWDQAHLINAALDVHRHDLLFVTAVVEDMVATWAPDDFWQVAQPLTALRT